MERFCSWPSWISARTRSHSEKGPERPLVPPDHGCDGETVSPSPQSNSQTLAGEPVHSRCVIDQPWTCPRRIPSTLMLRHSGFDALIVVACLRQHRPGDPRQLIGECGCQDVMM